MKKEYSSHRLILSLLLLLVGTAQGWGNSKTYYAKLTANLANGATGKGLVYASNSNSTPAASSYASSLTSVSNSNSSTGDNASVALYAWAKPARGYQFSSWTVSSNASANSTTSASTSVSVTASSTNSDSPTTGTVSANFTDATDYKTITYKTPTDGTYSIAYSWDNAIGSSGFTTGDESYNMTPSSADKAVKSYTTDQVTLSTTMDNFEGWYQGETLLSTDKTYSYSVTADAAISAKFTAASGNEASVTSNGSTIEYATLLEAFVAANKLSTNPTVTLLRNVYTADTIYNITKSMTFDLNGFTLSGKGGRPLKDNLARRLFTVNGTGINVTFKDSSTGGTGTINCTAEVNNDLFAIYLNNGTLNIESGVIHSENTAVYSTSNSGYRRMRCYGIFVNSNKTLNVKGGSIEAVGDWYAYGVNMNGSTQTASPTTVNVTGGNISATLSNTTSGQVARGINTNGDYRAQSKVNISDGTIKASGWNNIHALEAYADYVITGGNISASAKGGGDCYGIVLGATSYQNVSNAPDITRHFHGTLNMSGGSVKSTNTSNGARTIRVNRSVYNSGQTINRIETAEAKISGGTITAEAAGSTAMAVEAYGDCDITGGTFTASTGTNNCYGVRAVYGKTTISGNNTNITATGTQGVYGATAAAEISGSTGIPAVGELEVNGGNISATANTTNNAYGILVQASAIEITSTATGYYKGLYHAAANATINGGKISATAKNTASYAVFVQTATKTGSSTSGTVSDTATCIINGGMFKAAGASGYACVNNAATSKYFTINSGYYQQTTNLASYIPETKTVYNLTSSINSTAYSFGCRYYVTAWDDTKSIALNQSTNKTYTSLKTALDEAASGATVVLTDNYRLTEGVTVPSGVTLLIPFDAGYTCYTTKPTTVYNTAVSGAYKTLFMSKDASITVNGSISVSAKMNSAGGGQQRGGAPCGQYGLIKMSEGSSITLNSGAGLYVWGYISGDGTIEAKSGSKVYEGYQINDFRGGTATTSMSQSNKVLPFSQYYIQNIESALTINYGATEHVYSSLYMSSTIFDTDFDLIGSSAGMFRLNASGASLVKRYNPTTDMLEITLAGTTSMNSINVKLGNVASINSSYYVLPVNDMDINIKSGTTTINQDLAIIPGTQLFIEDGANMNIASGKSLYVYDLDEWGQYAGAGTKIRPVNYTVATGTKGPRTEAGLTDVKVEINGTITGTGNLYTTASGANICSSGYGKVVLSTVPSSGSTYQYTQSGSSVTLHTISVTAAQLHNADGSYVKTAGASAGTTYYYSPYDGVWQTSAPVATEYDFSGHKLSTKDGKPFVTKSNLASAMTSTVGSGTLLSADFTNAKSNLSVAEMRVQIGAKDGNNILLYTTANADGADNVVVKTDDSYTAQSLVITDKQPMDVPTAFTAANVTYDRTNSNKWGTVCVPYQLTSGNGIQYYQLDSVKGSTMYFTKVETVAANQPAIYSVGADGTTIHFGGTDVEVSTTAANNVASGSLTLVGVQTDVKTLHADSTDYYYIAQNKFWQPTKNDVTVRPQRAYFKTDGAASLAKVLSIGISDDAATGISSAETSEPTVVGIYTLGGAKLNTIEKGVNIVKMSDGSTRKIIVR